MNDKNGKIKNMINNKFIENHIADMLENVLGDENKSEIDVSLISENQSQNQGLNQTEDFYNERIKRNFMNKDLEYFPKNLNIRNNYMKSNSYNNENYAKPYIFVNAPEEENDFMDRDRMPNNNFLMNQYHNYNNNPNSNHIPNNLNTFSNNKNIGNVNNLMNLNNIQSNYQMKMIPGINNLSPINNYNTSLNPNNIPNNKNNFNNNINFNNNFNNDNNNFSNQYEEEYTPKKTQNNRLHINYVGPHNQYMNKNCYYSKNSRNNSNNSQNSNSPNDIRNKSSDYINPNNNDIKPISQRDSDNNSNNIRISSPRLSYVDNNISTSNIR